MGDSLVFDSPFLAVGLLNFLMSFNAPVYVNVFVVLELKMIER